MGRGRPLHCGSVGESEDVIRLGQCLGRPCLLCYSIKVTFVHRRNSHFTVGEYPEKESWGKNQECETEEKLGLKE